MYFVYLLECEDGTLYTGFTKNLNRRVHDHFRLAGAQYTRRHKIKRLLYYEFFDTESKALRRERQIKGWRKEKKLNLVKLKSQLKKDTS